MAKNTNTDPVRLVCARHQVIFHAGEQGAVWRVAEGWVRLDRPAGSQRQLVQVALAGDLIGAEALCGQPYQFEARAMADCLLERVAPGEAEAPRVLGDALLQQQRRSTTMSQLRTGPVLQRLSHMLDLLGLPWRQETQQRGARKQLPPLRELAEVVDAKQETICRALAQLLPAAATARVPLVV
jgi:Cyclic nucleotide-binding domain